MRFVILALCCWLPTLLLAQSPEAIQYQAVARDGNGQLLSNQTLSVRLSIKASGPAGTTVYQETHATSTNDYGLFTLLIGQGNPSTGTFSTIDWSANSHFLRVEIDNGNGFIDLGSTQLVSVPYALYAKEAGNVGGANYQAGIGIDIAGNTISNTAPDQTVSLTGAGATTISGSYPNFVINSTDNNTTYNAGAGLTLSGQTMAAQNQSALWNANALQGNPIDNAGPAVGHVLKWNGSQWSPGTDDTATTIWTRQDTNIYFQGGKVGIGRSNPITTFHVAADQTVLFGNSDKGAGRKWLYNPAKNAIRGGELTAGQKDLWDPDSLGSGSFAHGTNVIARNVGTVVFGANSVASGEYSLASGFGSKATGHFSTAVGSSSEARGINSFAAGLLNYAWGDQAVAIGHLDTASGDNSIAIGFANAATGDGAIALGEKARAYGGSAVALGNNVQALSGGIAIGDDAFATDNYAIAIGKGLMASGEFSIAIGASPTASGSFSTSIGLLTQAQGLGAVAMGEGDTASGNHSIAMGLYSAATANGAIAIGRQAISRGEGVAIGSQAFALKGGDVALGEGNEARGGKSFSAGAGNITNGVGSAALGSGNIVNGATSTAVGLGHTVNSPYALAAGLYSEGLNNVLFEVGAGSQPTPITVFNVMTNGEVGIQNTNPDGMLHVGETTGANLFIGSAENFEDGGAFTLHCDTDLDPDSDIGHSLGSSSLRWNRLYAANGVVTTSDKREKQNISPLPYGLSTLMQLRPVSYEWKEQNPDRSTQLGLLAQDLQQVIPEVVVDTDFELDEESGQVKEVPAAQLGVEYSQLIPVLIKSVQEQQATIEALQAEVNLLKTQLKD